MADHVVAPAPPRPTEVGAVADGVFDLLRTVRKAKARLIASDSRADVESATQVLLHSVAELGPVRTSALAASVQSDLSTVSRQVGPLVTDGLVERRADPADGRACLLALTPAGEAAVAAHDEARAAFFAEVLDGWTPDELRQFSDLLTRFTTAYDHVHDARTAKRAARRVPLETLKGVLS
jgi:DNA-binding MarR family transcriptional regulator